MADPAAELRTRPTTVAPVGNTNINMWEIAKSNKSFIEIGPQSIVERV
jgi:hypothetical protein